MRHAAYGSTRLTNQDGTWVLALGGEHDLATLPQLEQQMEQICATGTSVRIDLSRATFIDCRVVGWLLRWSKRAHSTAHQHLAVATGSSGSFATRVIDLLKATETVPCHATTAEALTSLRHSDARSNPVSMSSPDGEAADLYAPRLRVEAVRR